MNLEQVGIGDRKGAMKPLVLLSRDRRWPALDPTDATASTEAPGVLELGNN